MRKFNPNEIAYFSFLPIYAISFFFVAIIMLKQIYIKKFKGIAETTINCNESYNVLIGANNVGKSSIFEAVHFWKMCYDSNVTKKKDGLFAEAHNLLFNNTEIIRLIHDNEIFPWGENPKKCECEITLTLELEGMDYKLGFLVTKPTHVDDAYIQVKYKDKGQFKLFSDAVKAIQGVNASNVISINETRPIANIIANEPRMTSGQIKEKIAKGKSYEVLRNKIINREAQVANHIEYVTGTKPTFSWSDNNAYIEMKVDHKNILSCGSGFLQMAEIFSSIEFSSEAKIRILLIDEPDAHIHVKEQRKLVNRLMSLQNFQSFIISHNERFVSETEDESLFFVNNVQIAGNVINSIDPIMRPLLFEGLTGIANDLDSWRTAEKIVIVEGGSDFALFNNLLQKYESIHAPIGHNIKFFELHGIDTFFSKLAILTKVMKPYVGQNVKWLYIRDTDCYPRYRINALKAKIEKSIRQFVPFDTTFQNGYGIESTFMTSVSHLAKILRYRYTFVSQEQIENIINNVNSYYNVNVHDPNNSLYTELEQSFNRQKKSRSNLYKGLNYSDVLSNINNHCIQYIMTKTIANMYYEEIHNRILAIDQRESGVALTYGDVESLYLHNLYHDSDFYPFHINLIQQIINI